MTATKVYRQIDMGLRIETSDFFERGLVRRDSKIATHLVVLPGMKLLR